MDDLRPAKGFINGCAISLIFWLALFLFLTQLACGMPVVKSPKPHPPIVTFPVPSRVVTESPAPSERVACGSLWVRSGAGVEFERVGIALNGNRMQLTGREGIAKDGGLWYQVVDRDGYSGWVNARYLCEEK